MMVKYGGDDKDGSNDDKVSDDADKDGGDDKDE